MDNVHIKYIILVSIKSKVYMHIVHICWFKFKVKGSFKIPIFNIPHPNHCFVHVTIFNIEHPNHCFVQAYFDLPIQPLILDQVCRLESHI